jgi:hypothetical protein
MSWSFSSVKTRFLFNVFLSIKMPWIRTFFTNLEVVPPDGDVVSENYGEIFSCTIFMSYFSYNNHKWKLFCSKLYLTRALKTQNIAQQKEACVTLDGTTLTGSLITWSPNEWPSACRGIPRCLPTLRSQKLPGHLTSLQNEHLVFNSNFLGFMVVQVISETEISVCITTRLWDGRPEFDHRQGEDPSFLPCVQMGSGAHPTSDPMDIGGSFPRRSAQTDADHCLSLVPEVKTDWSYTAYLHTKAKAYSALQCQLLVVK